MDKEMNNGMRELSMDEMDKVSGGACYNANAIKSEADLDYFVYTYIASMEKSFGKHIVASILKDQGCSYNMIEDYYSAGLDGLDNALGIWKLDRPGGFH